jgi:RNA polymerase sigma factor (sigma-70 family)
MGGVLAAQSDTRLVELVQRGHERAFEAVVQRYRRPLLRYCERMGLSQARAEDVLQHALLQAWLALERGVEVRELRPWLYRIVHNTAINLVRSSREDHGPLSDAAHIHTSIAAEHDLERRNAVREALAGVAALPDMQRDAILLSAIDGRSHEEVADVLGVSHGAVRGLLYRARATLRAAAAAVIPQPLINWAWGSLGGTGATSQRLAELSAPVGAAGMTAALLKGAATALTAAVLVTGAAVVPLGLGGAHAARSKPRGERTSGAHAAFVAGSAALQPAGAAHASDALWASTGASGRLGGSRNYIHALPRRAGRRSSSTPAWGSAGAPVTVDPSESDRSGHGAPAGGDSSAVGVAPAQGSGTSDEATPTPASVSSPGAQPSHEGSASEREPSSDSPAGSGSGAPPGGSDGESTEVAPDSSSGEPSTETAGTASSPDG